MKILAISDMYVTTAYYEKCFAAHPEYELQVIKFGSDDFIEMRDKFHRIERKGPDEVEIPEEIYTAIEDADVLMVHICPVPAKLIEKAKKLRAVLTNRGGLENIAVEALTARGIPLLNNPAHNTNGVAELAIGLMVTEPDKEGRALGAEHHGGNVSSLLHHACHAVAVKMLDIFSSLTRTVQVDEKRQSFIALGMCHDIVHFVLAFCKIRINCHHRKFLRIFLICYYTIKSLYCQ